MSAAQLLERLNANGAVVRKIGDDLDIDAPAAALTDALLSELRANKPALMALLAANETPDHESILCWYSDRIAIMEADGDLSPMDAERPAWTRTLAHFGLPATYRLPGAASPFQDKYAPAREGS